MATRLPTNYTVLDTNSVNITRDAQYTNIIWNFAADETPNGFVTYVPFPIERIIRSFKITGDLSDYSSHGSIKETFETTYDVQTDQMLWNVSLHNINIPFPAKSTSILSISVYDGKGHCDLLTVKPADDGYTEHGYYFVDYDNRVVCIYARPSFESNNFSQFYVHVTYEAPKLIEPINKTVSWWQPYQKNAALFFDFNESAYWHLNMTGDFIVQFILPPQSQAIISDSDEFVSSPYDDNRDAVTRVYNSPVSIPDNEWIITFDNLTWRDAVYKQEASFFTLIIALIIAIVFGKFGKFKSELLAASAASIHV